MAGLRLSRPVYFNGMRLDAADFVCERAYFDTHRRLFNTCLWTWGIAAGLSVSPCTDLRSVMVTAGLAIAPDGQEIVVADDTRIQAPKVGGQLADLFVSVDAVPGGFSTASLAAGYTRIQMVPVFSFVPSGQGAGREAVYLATARLDEDGRIQSLDCSARRRCGHDSGSISFLSAADGSPVASLGAEVEGGVPFLHIAAAGLSFSGKVGLAGPLAIADGAQAPICARAMLDIASTADPLLQVTKSDGTTPLLTVGADRHSAIGAIAPTDAALSVDGDILMDGGRMLTFDGGGALASGASGLDLAVDLGTDGGGAMRLCSTGMVALVAGAGAAGGEPPTMAFAANGKVGIALGTATPPDTLTVGGWVRSLNGGFLFGDDILQPTSAASTTVRIGCVVDWWPGGAAAPPTEFMICDGSVITDPASPLQGVRLPDLRGLMVRGTTDYAGVGATGGSPQHTHQIMSIPSHMHDITHDHPTTQASTSKDMGEGDSDTVDSKCSTTDHTHGIGINVLQCAESQSRPNDTFVTPVTTNAFPTRPPSMGLVKIMRIK